MMDELVQVREKKGNSILLNPNKYVLVDIETTGLFSQYDEIIEISAIRIEDNKIVNSFSELIKPYNEISTFIENLTGITNEMVKNARRIKDVLKSFLSFINEEDILIGYNFNFDINFLYDSILENLKTYFSNDFIDVLRFSRLLIRENVKNCKLKTIANFYDIDYSKAHRGKEDCIITFEVFKKLQNEAINQYGSLEKFFEHRKNIEKGQQYNLKNISSQKEIFDEEHPMYRNTFCFTGKLEKMTRLEAAQIVVDFGGFVSNTVTSKTNFLVLGNNDYCSTIKDGKSSKQKKAEKMKLDGEDIEIIPENIFYEMI